MRLSYKDALSWTALFRAFSSHRQPSASLTKLFPSWTNLSLSCHSYKELETDLAEYASLLYKKRDFLNINTKGGVEDTRLETKDTKKIRGQGQRQPFRGQTLSRPKTGMRKAKTTDTGASVLQTKWSSKFFFRRSTKEKGF